MTRPYLFEIMCPDLVICKTGALLYAQTLRGIGSGASEGVNRYGLLGAVL